MSSEIGIEEHRQEVLRVCSYHRSDFASDLVYTRPRKIQVIAPLLQTHFTEPSPSKHGPPFRLGVLDVFTPELLVNILLQLDIVSYLRFRHVNRYARVIATHLPEYKLVSKHGLEGLAAILRTGLGEYFTIKDLYDPLVTYSCTVCGDFGSLLYLPDCTRCCFPCLIKTPKLHMTSMCYPYEELTHIMGVSRSELERKLRPMLQRVPRKCSLESAYHCCSVNRRLVKKSQFEAILESLEPWERELIKMLHSVGNWDCEQLASATVYPWYNSKRGEADHGVSCSGIQLHLEKTVHPDMTEPGAQRKHRDEVFTRAGFLQHFKTCGFAQDLWARRDNGLSARESWFILNGGTPRQRKTKMKKGIRSLATQDGQFDKLACEVGASESNYYINIVV